jgi:hypothetical protein
VKVLFDGKEWPRANPGGVPVFRPWIRINGRLVQSFGLTREAKKLIPIDKRHPWA